MYNNGFYIEKPIGNNELDFEKRTNKKIFVPSTIEGNFDNLEIGENIAFEIIEDGETKSFKGLKNFIRTAYNGIPVIVVDNHNHVFYFWYEALVNKIINKGIKLVHIDEHSDIKDSGKFLPNFRHPELDSGSIVANSSFLKEIFNFTNFSLNVGDYIKPAIDDGLISEYIKISSEYEIEEINKNMPTGDYILNIDIDFFSPNLDYIDYNLKKEVIEKLIPNAKLITIATSPYFIDQTRAIEVIKDIFRKN